jgi:hypothetical protein
MSDSRWHYFVGDIHGCFEEYMQLEEQIMRHAERNGVEPFVVSVGDLVDRGPASADVVRHFRRGHEAGTHVAVAGNHEAFMLASLWNVVPWDTKAIGELPLWLQPVEFRHQEREGYARVLALDDYATFFRCLWLGQGGYETLQSFGCDPFNREDWHIDPDDLRFLLQMPIMWENEDFVVTHALANQDELGFARAFASRTDEESSVLWLGRLRRFHSISYQLQWNREVPSESPAPGKIHISGHTVMERVNNVSRLGIRQIDTGCVYGHRLTAWCGEDDRYFRVPASLNR